MQAFTQELNKTGFTQLVVNPQQDITGIADITDVVDLEDV